MFGFFFFFFFSSASSFYDRSQTLIRRTQPELDPESGTWMVRRNGGRSKRYPLRNGRRYGSARDDSDEEYVLDEDEEDGDFGSDASLGIDDVSDEEEDGRDLVRASRRKTTGFHMCWGRKKGRNIGKFQEKEEVEKRKRGHQMRRRSRISYTEEDWKVEEDSEDDEDLSSTDDEEDEEDEEENVTVRKRPVKRKRKVAKNSTVSKNKKRGHQMRRRSRISYTEEDWKVDEDSEDDEDLSSTDEEDEEENVTVRKRLVKRKRKVAKNSTVSKNKKVWKHVNCRRRLNSDEEEEEEEDDDDFTITDENLSDTDEILMRKKFRRSSYPLRRRSRKSSVVDCDVLDFELQNPVVATRPKLRQNAVVPETKVEGENGKEIEKYKGKGKKIGSLNENICGICISKERKGIFRGFLNSCSHYFCFSCIMEWSKLESRCPLCKKRFTEITKSLNSNVGSCMGSCVKKIPKRDQVYRPTEEEVQEFLDPYANVVCIVCQHDEDDNLMLLCDLCDSSAHTYCVGHGRQVPDGSWFCDACTLLTPIESNMDNQRDSTIGDPLQNSEVSLPQNSNDRSEAVARGDRDISFSFTSPRHDQTQSSSHSEMLQIGSSTLLHRREVYQHIQNLRTMREPPGEELP